MLNNCLSVLYKHIIQVENKNVGLKVCVCVGGGGGTNIPLPTPIKICGGGGTYPPCPPASYASDIYIYIYIYKCFGWILQWVLYCHVASYANLFNTFKQTNAGNTVSVPTAFNLKII